MLARDSLEGSDRFKHGLKPESEFKSLGRSSKSIIQVQEGPAKGAWAYRALEAGKIVAKPLPQIGFLDPQSDYQYFLMKDVPLQSELDGRGFQLKAKGSIKIFGCEEVDWKAVLKEKGYNLSEQGVNGILDGEGKTWAGDLYARVDNIILRAVSKIAFNYLARWESRDLVLHSDFDKTRRFIRYGEMPGHPLCVPSNEPLLTEEPVEGKRVLAHMITLGFAGDGVSVVGQVTLFNHVKYKVGLAQGYSGEVKPTIRGHMFLPNSGKIFPLGHSPRRD